MGFYIKIMKNKLIKIYEIFLDHNTIGTNSRNIQKNAVFFALKGDNFNGNKFAEEALGNGAAFAVVDEIKYVKDNRYILVENTLSTLQELSIFHRSKINIPVVAITGTNGKTTTKELAHKILSQKYNAQATQGNLNNHIGVPLSILSANRNTEILVLEMGANHIGEIEFLCKLANPNYGIITNIGKAHLEGFGSEKGVIKAKSELYSHLENIRGTAFVNLNDQLLTKLSNNLKKILYGNNTKADIYGEILEVNPFLKISWNYKTSYPLHKKQTFKINSKLIGTYNFENILAAIAIGHHFGVEPEKIKKAITDYIPVNNRSQIIKKGEKIIILDAYNANPTNMEAAILNLKNIPGNKKIAIIGDMLELGKYSEQEHCKILKLLKEQDFDRLLLVGPRFFNICEKEKHLCFENTEDAYSWLKNNSLPDSVILIKASRGMNLEKLAGIL